MIYDELGVRTVINAVGPATRFGGLDMAPEVWAAMQQATRTSVRVAELQQAVGRELANLLKVPGAYVTSGASAALTLAAAVCMAGADPALIDQLPGPGPTRRQFVIQRAQRDPYDRALTAAGGQLVEIGYPTSTHRGELTRVLTDATAAVLVRPGAPGNLLDLATTAEIAHQHGVPVIVDAAVVAPPLDRLPGLFTAGADLVAVSGGKGLRGPQASGLLLGRPEMLAGVALQHQDMDEREETWLAAAPMSTPPRHGLGRGMKVGREQIIGLLSAVRRHVADPHADDAPGIAELHLIHARLTHLDVVALRFEHDDRLDVPTLVLRPLTVTADELAHRLADRPTPVFLGEDRAWAGELVANPMALLPGQGQILAQAVIQALDIPASEGEPHA